MSETSSVPLWFSGLTFLGGVLGGQLTELLKSKRDRQARQEDRKATKLDKRNELQREHLFLLQETVAAEVKSFLFLVNNRSLIGASKELQKELSDTAEAHNERLWRIGVLKTRILDPEVRRTASDFYMAAQGMATFLRQIPSNEGVDDLFKCFNGFNASVASYLTKLDSADL